MLRHPDNSNQQLHLDPLFRNMRVQIEKGPLIANHLDRLWFVIEQTLSQYPRVFAFRFDLRLPSGYADLVSNVVIDRLLESFKAKIRHNRAMARRENPGAHTCDVRYVWAREFGPNSLRPHFHVAILLNRDAFCALGYFEIGRSNLFNRVQEAWACALGVSVGEVSGLVQFPDNPCYHLNRGDDSSIEDFLYRASYLCKAATKCYGSGVHGFGSSRR